MGSWKAGILLLLAGLQAQSQTMPYPVGWVYTASVLDLDNLAFISSTAADTGGASGHTTSAVVKLMSPDGKVSYDTGGWGYSSFAAGSLSLCDFSGQCQDGWFRASSEGTQEYCPITFTYMLVAESYADQEMQPFIVALSAEWSPGSVPRQNGKSDFLLKISKSPNCPSGGVQAGIGVFATDGLLFSLQPGVNDPNSAAFSGNMATVKWKAETSHNNPTAGEIEAVGTVYSGPCTILQGQAYKSARLRVQ